MNSKMTTNSQLSTTKSKNKNKLSKQLEQEQKWRSHGELSEGRRKGDYGGQGTGSKKHKW